jgi:hypothetical protein
VQIWTVQIRSKGARRLHTRKRQQAHGPALWTWSTGPSWTGANGVYPDLIHAVDLGSGSRGGTHAARGGARGGRRRHFTGVKPATTQNGLPVMVWDAVGLYADLRSRRTYPGGRGGGSGGHGGSQWKGAAAATPASKRRRGGAVCARQPEARGSSPCCDTPRKENDDEKATAGKIDDEQLQAALRE